MNKLFTILLALSLFTVTEGFAQLWKGGAGIGKFTTRKRYWSVGTTFSTMQYFGDLVPKNRVGSLDLKFTRPNVGFFIQRRYFPRVTFRMATTWGQLAGEDHTSSDPNDLKTGGYYRYKRNLHFRNNIFDLSFVAIFDLQVNRGMAINRPTALVPYALLGFGGFYHNPQAIRPQGFEGSKWVDLRPLRTEGQGKAYSPVSISFPAGLGVRWRISDQWDVAVEGGWRFTLTDYIDDVSGDYKDLGYFTDDLTRALHDRSAEPIAVLSGQPRSPETITYVSKINGQTYTVVNGYGMPNNRRGAPDKDAYLVTGFQVSYIFSGGTRGPKFR
jgi:Domain of unknown function (DUF6089)